VCQNRLKCQGECGHTPYARLIAVTRHVRVEGGPGAAGRRGGEIESRITTENQNQLPAHYPTRQYVQNVYVLLLLYSTLLAFSSSYVVSLEVWVMRWRIPSAGAASGSTGLGAGKSRVVVFGKKVNRDGQHEVPGRSLSGHSYTYDL